MPRRTILIVDQAGERLGILRALREQWVVGEEIVVRGRPYQVAAIVELDPPDSSGASAMLIVAEPPATAA